VFSVANAVNSTNSSDGIGRTYHPPSRIVKDSLVGLWAERVAVGAGRELAGVDGVASLYRSGEWEFGNVLGNFSRSMEDVVDGVALQLDAPAIGFYVADSDAAAVYFAGPDSPVGRLAINHSYDDSDDAHTEQWLDPEQHRGAAAALAAWAAEYAPRKPADAEIVAALAALEDAGLSNQLGERAMVFAEEGVEAIFNQLLGIGTIHAE
jgi:hypothetical protein